MSSILLELLLASAVAVGGSDAPGTSSGDVQQYLSESAVAIADGRLSQAKEMLLWLDAHGDESDASERALLRSEYYAAQGRVVEAEAALAFVSDTALRPCRQGSVRAWISTHHDQVDRAILYLSDVTQHCPGDAGAWNLLGLAFAQKGEFAAAKEAFDMGLSIFPGSAEMLNNKAMGFARQGDYEQAATLLEQARKANPDSEVVAANADYVAGRLGKDILRRQVDDDQRWATRMVNAGNGAQASGRGDMATALFAKAVLLMDRHDEHYWRVANGERGGDK